MRTSTPLLAGMIAIAFAFGVACDGDDAADPGDTPAEAAREQSGGWSAYPGTPAASAVPATPALPDATAVTGTPAAAAPPTPGGAQPPPAVAPAPTTQAASLVSISLEQFDCGAYRFVVQSQPAALYKVHWTASAPAEPGTGGSVSVSDHEVSQSPGEHTFTHSEDGWSEPGSNRLRITAWDVGGQQRELTQDIDC